MDSGESTAVLAENEEPPSDVVATATDTGASSVEAENEELQGRHRKPFRVYVAIASEALAESLKVDKTDDTSTVSEIFKRACAQHRPPLPYDGELTRKAVEAARFSRDKAAGAFRAQLKAVAHRGSRATVSTPTREAS